MHKCHALLHGQRLCSRSWTDAVDTLNATLTWTGDLGTESGIVDVLCPFKTFFPWVTDHGVANELHENLASAFEFDPADPAEGDASDEAVADFDFEAEHPGAAMEYEDLAQHAQQSEEAPDLGDRLIDFTGSAYIPGVLHVVHNCAKDMGAGLTLWNTWLEGLTHISRLLTNDWSKTRLIRTCFSQLPASAFTPQIEAYKYPVFSGRWGTLLIAAQELLPLQNVLVRAWSLRAYGLAQNRPDDETASWATKLDVVDSAIRNPVFWAYTRMVSHAATALLKIAGWSEGCPCHQEDFEVLGRRLWRDVFRKRTDEEACPMKSRRAPECARGALFENLRSFLEVANGDVLLDPSMQLLTQTDQSDILRDFSTIRRRIMCVCVCVC